MSDDNLTSFHDCYQIGEKVIEMLDRLKVANKYAPGAVASWGIDCDGIEFEVMIRIKREKVT